MKILIAILLFPVVLALKKECPGGKDSCPDGSTCCELLNMSYGCCPLQNAVCCDDHIHCCPTNTKCIAGSCVKNMNTSADIHLIQRNEIICPNSSHTCPNDATCCRRPYWDPDLPAEYDCCLLPHAVCCNDGLHCCPGGTTCNLALQICMPEGYVTEMYDSKKKSVRPLRSETRLSRIQLGSKQVSSVVCPDSAYQCPDSYTCCKLQTGAWGCCPFPNATCCADGIHCCPEYMYCDATSQFCSQVLKNTTSLPKRPATQILMEVNQIICPDKTQCDDEDTCCKLSEEKFGCCHYPNATCCSDYLHCCPSDHVCDLKSKRCVPKKNWLLNVLDNFLTN